MVGAGLTIVYEPDRGRPLTVAQVGDRRLLVAVAEAAIAEVEQRAQSLTEADAFLGAMHREEAARLRRVLGILIPEMSDAKRHLTRVPRDGEEQADASCT